MSKLEINFAAAAPMMPRLVDAETSYRESLCQLARWTSSDRMRKEQGVADTQEHLELGLQAVDLVARMAHQSVDAHDRTVAALRVASPTTMHCALEADADNLQEGELVARRSRFAGTAPYLGQLFDQLAQRMHGSAGIGGAC